ncbi:Callose synthase 3 [Abeliophyllum distichum]|uniref:Callose synthase 3 n=1 Tax=Abeliophyllum distichum TaxID=126358 RepID=A0ABD1P3D3_9LAMI
MEIVELAASFGQGFVDCLAEIIRLAASFGQEKIGVLVPKFYPLSHFCPCHLFLGNIIIKKTKSILVYGLSWLVIFAILLVVKAVSVGRKRLSAELQIVFRLIKGFIFLSFVAIAQALRPLVVRAGIWGSVRTLARSYEIVIGLLLFTPVAFLAWFPFVSEFQTRMLFNQAFSRGLQISRILGGPKKDRSSSNK